MLRSWLCPRENVRMDVLLQARDSVLLPLLVCWVPTHGTPARSSGPANADLETCSEAPGHTVRCDSAALPTGLLMRSRCRCCHSENKATDYPRKPRERLLHSRHVPKCTDPAKSFKLRVGQTKMQRAANLIQRQRHRLVSIISVSSGKHLVTSVSGGDGSMYLRLITGGWLELVNREVRTVIIYRKSYCVPAHCPHRFTKQEQPHTCSPTAASRVQKAPDTRLARDSYQKVRLECKSAAQQCIISSLLNINLLVCCETEHDCRNIHFKNRTRHDG